jgi:dolichol kinase
MTWFHKLALSATALLLSGSRTMAITMTLCGTVGESGVPDYECIESNRRHASRWHRDEAAFWNPTLNGTYNILLLPVAFLLFCYLLGRGVKAFGWNPNYTRKTLGLAMLLTNYAVAFSPIVFLGSSFLLLAALGLLSSPFRSRFEFLATAFAAIDRPEDRPHTLWWFVTAYVASWLILVGMLMVPGLRYSGFIAIALASVGLGDLVAGVVGYRFGKYRYRTVALGTTTTYTRSWEGSACVWLITFAAVVYFGSHLPHSQFIATLIAMPVIMALAEAKSPHTWDEPVMMGAALLTGLAILIFIPPFW